MAHKRKHRLPRTHQLEKLGLKKEWIEPWSLDIDEIMRTDHSSWRLFTSRGEKILRKVEWPSKKMHAINSFLDHLGRNGLKTIPRFIRTVGGEPWVEGTNCCYYLCDYIESVPISLLDTGQLASACQTLAQFHNCSAFFAATDFVSAPLQWQEQWESELNQLRQHMVIGRETGLTAEFDELSADKLERIAERIEEALEMLQQTGYPNFGDRLPQLVCHNYFKEPHIRLTSQGDIYLDRFDDCDHNLRIWDISRFLCRVMVYSGWNIAFARLCLKAYEEIAPLLPLERKLVVVQLLFPNPSAAYLRAYLEKAGSASPLDLIRGLRREDHARQSRNQMLDWLQRWAN